MTLGLGHDALAARTATTDDMRMIGEGHVNDELAAILPIRRVVAIDDRVNECATRRLPIDHLAAAIRPDARCCRAGQ